MKTFLYLKKRHQYFNKYFCHGRAIRLSIKFICFIHSYKGTTILPLHQLWLNIKCNFHASAY